MLKASTRCRVRGGEHTFQPMEGLGEEMMLAGVWNRGYEPYDEGRRASQRRDLHQLPGKQSFVLLLSTSYL